MVFPSFYLLIILGFLFAVVPLVFPPLVISWNIPLILPMLLLSLLIFPITFLSKFVCGLKHLNYFICLYAFLVSFSLKSSIMRSWSFWCFLSFFVYLFHIVTFLLIPSFIVVLCNSFLCASFLSSIAFLHSSWDPFSSSLSSFAIFHLKFLLMLSSVIPPLDVLYLVIYLHNV